MRIVEISPKTIVYLTLFPLALFFVWIIRDLLFSLLIGFILMSALRPGVEILAARKLPRSAAVLVIYFLFVFIFIFLISLVIPPIVTELSNLINSLPTIISNVNPNVQKALNLNDITKYIPSVTDNIPGFIGSVFSNTLFIVSTLFFGLYFLLEEDLIKKFLSKYLDPEKTFKISTMFEKAEDRMSSWFWGQITLMLVVGVLTYIGLSLIGMKYALPLAVLAGLLEVVPNVGPVISAVPALLIGWTSSYFTGFSVLALYLVVQQLENNLIVPMIMKRTVGINPIITLIALLIGGRVGGVLGVLLSIPLFLFAETVITEILHNKKSAEKSRE
jgi:predicted PurR-regulated permease PerM